MLQLNEIRVGNLVQNEFNQEEKILEISIIQGEEAYINRRIISKFTQLPITNQKLLSLGFQRNFGENNDIFSYNLFSVFNVNNSHWYYISDPFKVELTSIHHMQNLFYDIYKKEITPPEKF